MMSTEVARPAGKVKLTVDEFRQIIDTGVFEDRRVQLLDGELFEVTKNPPHDFTVSVVADRLRTILPARRWVVREEKTIEPWPFWWPEPDITVARGPHRRYEHRHPGPRDIALLVEVCDTSQYEDRVKKPPAYARIEVPQYWVIDINRRAVEVFTHPLRLGRPPRYLERSEYTEGDAITVTIEGRKYRPIRVAEILPSPTKKP